MVVFVTAGTLTTKHAAELAGITPASFRREMHRERARGRDYRAQAESWPDDRTPLWDKAALRPWLASRGLLCYDTHTNQRNPS